MTHVTCRLTTKNRDLLREPIRSVIEYGLPLLLHLLRNVCTQKVKYAYKAQSPKNCSTNDGKCTLADANMTQVARLTDGAIRIFYQLLVTQS